MRNIRGLLFLALGALVCACTSASNNGGNTAPITVTGVSLANNTLTVTGTGLDTATSAQIQGVSGLTILSQSATQLKAVPTSNITLALGTLYNLLISSAEASGSTTISFGVSGANSGSVLFADSSGNATTDNGNLYWDGTNHRLGIGTTTPDSSLSILGSATDVPALLVVANGSPTDKVGIGETYASAYSLGEGIQFFAATGVTGNPTSSNVVLTAYSRGWVGIGTSTPSSLLQVGTSGDGSDAVANAWATFSDVRLKKDIHPIEGALEKVLKLRGVTFVWKKDKKERENIGFIAQEVEKVFPQLVTTNANGYKSLSYGNFVAVLTNAIKEMYVRVDTKLDHDHAEIVRLKKESAAKDREIGELKAWACSQVPRPQFCRK